MSLSQSPSSVSGVPSSASSTSSRRQTVTEPAAFSPLADMVDRHAESAIVDNLDSGPPSPVQPRAVRAIRRQSNTNALGVEVRKNSFTRMGGSPAGSFSGGARVGSFGTVATDTYDPQFVRAIGRHLVSPAPSHDDHGLPQAQTSSANGSRSTSPDARFYDLTLQGGDITRQLYRWQRDHEGDGADGGSIGRRGRSQSFTALPRPEPADENMSVHNINVPGGFRRNYIINKSGHANAEASPGSSGSPASSVAAAGPSAAEDEGHWPRPFLTRNFLEFLSVYGHFAGEELGEEDEDYELFDDGESGETSSNTAVEDDNADESTGLLNKPSASGRQPNGIVQDTTATKAIFLLLKGFVGTGVLFLPKAYYNGGMLFSSGILVFVAILTYYCFVLLIDSRMRVNGSFGDMGGTLYGNKMRVLILFSIVVSQIGFSAAYTVFTAENLQAFIMAVTKCRVFVPTRYLIFLQMIVFVPLSMVRNISKLSLSSLIANIFILLGLVYVFFSDTRVLVQHGVSDVQAFNRQDWTLFIGTAIFTFEGIGLVIPIQESMKKPQQFYAVIAFVMGIISVVYIAMGVMSYAAFGSHVETVVILNLPQTDKLVNAIQFIYAIAILLSTPLAIFPAIRILENAWLSSKSGKFDPKTKWKKNGFRAALILFMSFVAWGGADDLDKFVALIGSLACIPLTYIYPPMLHYRACAKSVWMKGLDAFICVFGFIAMVYTTTSTIESWAKGDGGPPDLFKYCDAYGSP
ncbi:transmembrane amino acid transporter protein-domain-containing protein [Dipodascopsis tothii]|uniref:transmembrane amino acid transporter protein-domain-containing protein n=1 Tax=Dipodascopsis tothii TaxID=44089 RepID=UPI0034CD95FA